MRKKIYFLVLPLLLMCSCTPAETINKFELNSFEQNDDKYYIEVNNNQESFDFKEYVNSTYEWTVSSDSFGKEIYLTKTIPLSIGNNEYFVIANNENFDTFDCIIRRLDMFSISFNSNGGSYVPLLNVQEGSIVKEIPVPTREGYAFDGWNYDFSNPITGDLSLTAQWTANAFYVVNYDLNGGEGSQESLSIELGATGRYAVGLNICKEGYYLDSWNTKKDGTGTSYTPGSMINNPTIETVTLYAIWEPNELWDGVTKNYPITDGEYYYVRRASELSFYGKTILLNDIDLNNHEWTPASSFKGEFDGNNHKIKNMKITKVPSSGHIGLVSQNKGLIKNVILENYAIVLSNIKTSNELYIGGLVGENRGIPSDGDGKIENCQVSGTITINGATSGLCVGGLVGRTQSYLNPSRTYIIGSSSSGTITISSSASVSCGGIVGNDTWNPIKMCYSSTNLNVSTSGRAYVGGIIGGYNGGNTYSEDISNCVALGDISVSSGTGNASAFLGHYDYLPLDQLNNNYSLNTQIIIFNSSDLTSSGGTCRVETRTSFEVIKSKIPYDINNQY